MLALALSGWMRYVSGVDDAEMPVDVHNPLSDKLANLLRAAAVNNA
ncbi:hypothetical protein ACLK1S_13505 [Escherichia coli]